MSGEESDTLSWDDVVAAIVEQFYKLAPDDYRKHGHKDLVFGTNIQDLVAAVWAGIDAVAPVVDTD